MAQSLFDKVYAAAFPAAPSQSFFIMPRARSTMAFSYANESASERGHLCRLDNGDSTSRKIYELLSQLQSSSLAGSVPYAHHCEELGDRSIVVLEVVSGEELNPTELSPSEAFPAVSAWLAQLALQTPAISHLSLPSLSDRLSPWQGALSHSLGSPSAQFLAHGDLRPEHILRRTESERSPHSVYDWETAALAPALYDWFYFLTYYSQQRYFPQQASSEGPENAWLRAFFEQPEEPLPLRQCTLALAAEVGVAPSQIGTLLREFFIYAIAPTHWLATPLQQETLVKHLLSQKNVFDA